MNKNLIKKRKSEKFTRSSGKIKMNLISVESAFHGWKNVPEKWLKSSNGGIIEIRGKIKFNFIIRAMFKSTKGRKIEW